MGAQRQPKRHHYLPQSYLRLFGREEIIWVYDRKVNAVRAQLIVDTAVESHFYTIERADGSRDTWLEQELSKVEGLFRVLADKLRAREVLDDENRFELAFLAALMFCRVPDFREETQRIEGHLIKLFTQRMYRSEADAARSIAEHKAAFPEAPKLDPEELFRFCTEGKYDIKVHKNRSIQLMLGLSPEIAASLETLNIGVVHAPAHAAFVTTDRPLVILPPQNCGDLPQWGGTGILTPGAQKYLPLASDLVVIFGDVGRNFVHIEATPKMVKATNAVIGGATGRFLFGRDEALVTAWAQRLRLGESVKTPRMEVF